MLHRGGQRTRAAAAVGGLLLTVVAASASASADRAADPSAPGAWLVMSRSEGCVDLSVLARGDRLPRPPISPADYADLMRARGHQPTLGLPPGFPPELAGKVVMVKVRDDHAPVFVHEDICRQAEGRR